MWIMPRGLALAGILASLLGIGTAALILERAAARSARPRHSAAPQSQGCRPSGSGSPLPWATTPGGGPRPGEVAAEDGFRLRCLSQ